jgi:hypothetical protein
MASEPEQMFLNTRQESDITTRAQTIVDLVNRHKIIGPEYTLGVEVLFNYVHGVAIPHQVTSVSVSFYIELSEDISEEKSPSEYRYYCGGLYYNTRLRGQTKYICKIADVKSQGNRVGVFLTQLQILLAIKVNSHLIELENMTDSPERAATGIYSMFTPYAEGVSIRGLDLHEQLIETIGSMRLTVDRGTMGEWIQKVKSMTLELNEKEPPWGENAKKKLDSFLRAQLQYGGKHNSKRRKRKKRFTRKRK